MTKVLFLFLLMLVKPVFGDSVDLSNDGRNINISNHFSYFLSANEFSAEDVLEMTFKPIERDEIKFDYTTETIWLKTSLKNNSSKDISKIVYFDSTLTGFLDLYKAVARKPVLYGKTGSSVPYDHRIIKSTFGAFKIVLKAGEEINLLFKRRSHHRLDSHVYLVNENEFSKVEENKMTVVNLYVGAFFSMLIYNLFLYLYSREKSYLVYSVWIVSMGVLALNFLGIIDIFLFQTFTFSHYLLISTGFAIISLNHFTANFLQIEMNLPKFKPYFNFGKVVAAIIIIIFLSPLRPAIAASLGTAIDLLVAYTIVLMVTTGIKSCFNKHVMAKFYLISWGFFFLGALCLMSIYLGILPKSPFTTYGLLWGNLCEMLIISIALAFKLSILDQQRQVAEFKALGKEQYERLVRVLLHDISNPLQISLSYSSILQKLNTNEEMHPHIEKITRSSKNIQNTIKSIRAQYSKTIDRDSISIEKVDLQNAFDECLFLYENKLLDKKIDLQFSIEQGAEYISANRDILIISVFGNLISNAIKFSHENSNIIVVAKSRNDQVVIDITDFGVGLSKGEIDYFLSTGQIHHREGTLQEPGLGYGVLLVTSYMKFFKGRLDIESLEETETEAGKTTFSLVFMKPF